MVPVGQHSGMGGASTAANNNMSGALRTLDVALQPDDEDSQHLHLPLPPSSGNVLNRFESTSLSDSFDSPSTLSSPGLTKALLPQASLLDNGTGYIGIKVEVVATDQPEAVPREKPEAAEQLSVWLRLWNQACKEFWITGRMVNRCLTPAPLDHHWIVFTPCLLISMLAVFAFMAAQLPYYLAYKANETCNITKKYNCTQNIFPTSSMGPAYMWDWFSHPDTNSTTMTFDFMNIWGARYAPPMADGQWYRWFTSQFVHANLVHLFGNMVVFAALAIPLERRFGWALLMLVWTLAVVGGELLSTAAEDPCTLIIGASGGVFGMVGLFAADLILNRQYLEMPIYRTCMTFIFLGIFLGTVFVQPQVSHMSHLGGLVCGLLPSFLILPNKRADTLQKVLPMVGLISLVVWFTVLPAWVYTQTFSNLQCDVINTH